jgi:uncharacterized protein (DUF2252 family)
MKEDTRPGCDPRFSKIGNIPLTFSKINMSTTVAERVKEFNSNRVPIYTQLKYKLMALSPFRFLRGSCHLFYEDLARADPFGQSPTGWICGDLHVENFGSYKGDNRLVYFDLNDFDEAILAPVSWELARMVTSIFVAFATLQIKSKEALRMAKLFLRVYASELASGKATYIEPQVAKGIVRFFLTQVQDRKAKTLLQNRTIKDGKKMRLGIDNKRFYALEPKLKNELRGFLTSWLKQADQPYSRYRFQDAAVRVAGTGSVGVKRFVFLVRHIESEKKYLLIDMKLAAPSSLAPYIKISQPLWQTDAQRVATIQRRMQNTSPAMLSDVLFKEESYVLKELQPVDDKIDFLIIKDIQKDIARVIKDMARLTASAQLRSSGRQGAAIADELVAFGQDQHWQKPILEYSSAYSKQVKKDFQAYLQAYKAGFFSKK